MQPATLRSLRSLPVAAGAALLVASACSAPKRSAEEPAVENRAPDDLSVPTAPTIDSSEAPLERLEYWARPGKSVEEFLETLPARGIQAKHRVEVATMQELIGALAPNTIIILRSGERYLFEDSNALGDAAEKADLADWSTLSPHYKDGEIRDIENLVIVGAGPRSSLILQPDSYVHALSFRNVKNVALYNLTVGHWPEEGYCQGGVIKVIEGENIVIGGSTLFGSGTEGVSLVTVDRLVLEDSVITNSTQQFATISNSRDVRFDRVRVVGNDKADLLRGFAIYRSSVEIANSEVSDNAPLQRSSQDSYGLLFAIDGDYDWGNWYQDSPRPVEPERKQSTVWLRNTVIDNVKENREL